MKRMTENTGLFALQGISIESHEIPFMYVDVPLPKEEIVKMIQQVMLVHRCIPDNMLLMVFQDSITKYYHDK